MNETAASGGPGGFLVAAIGSMLGMGAVFIIAGLAIHLTREPTFPETLSFDHDGQLELGGIFIFLVVIVALVLGAPFGTWFALKLGDHDRRWATVIAVAILAPIIGLVGLGRVPSAPGDPVLEPYVLLGSTFVVGMVGRLITTSARR
ncbi:MAG: hypothetical protein LC808_34975 [Actinobacteria bacterium]|nr:hypothetical protein [Actinomycetota bacterium]